MDALGGNGNGPAWFSTEDAAITSHPYYQQFSQMQIKDIGAVAVKAAIGESMASAPAAPIVNYLYWVLTMVNGVA